MINLEWLRTFIAIYECNNLTQAAERLHMTQPGASKHLAALENHIGKLLFERTTRSLAPTEYGKFLFEQINPSLKELEKVEFYANQRTKKQRHSISIGCTTDFFKKELMSHIYDFDMFIATYFGNEKDLIEALEMDKIQLLIGIKKYEKYNHQFTYIKSQKLELISSKHTVIPSDIATNNKKLSKWLQKQTWFTYNNSLEDIKHFWDVRFNESPRIIPRFVLPSYLDIVEILKSKDGFSVIPKDILQKTSDKELLKAPIGFKNKIEQQLFYSYKPKNSNLKEIAAFKEKLKMSNKTFKH